MTMLPRSLDPARLVAVPGVRHLFRYRLHAGDFHPLRTDGHLLGYDSETFVRKARRRGHVDRGGGFDGRIAAVFVPSPARSWWRARLVMARAPRHRLRRADGRRNWPLIRGTIERALRRQQARHARS